MCRSILPLTQPVEADDRLDVVGPLVQDLDGLLGGLDDLVVDRGDHVVRLHHVARAGSGCRHSEPVRLRQDSGISIRLASSGFSVASSRPST